MIESLFAESVVCVDTYACCSISSPPASTSRSAANEFFEYQTPADSSLTKKDMLVSLHNNVLCVSVVYSIGIGHFD